MKLFRLLLLLLSTVLFLVGCAGVAREERPRYVWPPDAETARIEYLGFYASEANLKGALFTTLSEVVLGIEPAKPLFVHPFAVDAWQDRILVTDTSTRNIYLLDLNRRKLGHFLLTNQQNLSFGIPLGVAIVDDNRFVVAEAQTGEIHQFSFGGEKLATSGKEEIQRPSAVAVDRRHRRIVVVDTPAHRLVVFTDDGQFLSYVGERGSEPGQFNYPVDADFDSEGNLFVLDSMNFRVQRFNWDGTSYRYASHFGETGSADGSFMRPKGLAVSTSGHIYVTDALGHKVVVFDRDGTFLLTFGRKFIATGGKFAPGGLYMPAGIAADDQDGIWVVDSLNRMVHHFQYLNETYLRDHPLHSGAIAPTVKAPE